jgi:transposase-like protein/IS1 family transposase
MIAPICKHERTKKHGRNRNGTQRVRCLDCGATLTIELAPERPKLFGEMRVSIEDSKTVLHLLTEGSSIRATSRLTGIDKKSICKLLVYFGTACREFLDAQMKGLTLDHLEFDEQWTFVYKKQSRLPVDDRRETFDQGDIYIWTAIDQRTKLMPSFRIGKRTGDNARRFMLDVASRLTWPNPHASDHHAYQAATFRRIVQISTDGFSAYPEAVDLAFGPYAKFGTIIKEYRNATMQYTPGEMVGTKRTARRGMDDRERFTICTSHVERLNGTQRLFLKRLNRLTYAFSKKLANLEAAFAMFAAWYNYCWRTRKPGKSGRRRPTAAVMNGLADHTWTFDELFDAVLGQ